jgi:electron transport complex protein RnfG
VSAPRPTSDRAELTRIVLSMTVTMIVAGVILGAVFMGTDRYMKASELARERGAIAEMLSLDSAATVTEVRQYLAPERREVIYRALPFGAHAGTAREARFAFDGTLRGRSEVAASEDGSEPAGLEPLGRLFVASAGGAPAGFVVEGESRGYKNRIRFFVALSSAFEILGVRVVEHEEDPGLGAEIATAWFQGQFLGRAGEQLARLDVTRDPMPEDWRAALRTLARTPAPAWRETHRELVAREAGRPIYAVTGATISSRALTQGVRTTVDHFRRRWTLVAPYLGGPA